MERWKVIDAKGHYEVSDQGVVRSRWTGRIISLHERRTLDGSRVLYVNMYDGVESRTSASVRQLVARAFIPNPDNARYTYNINGDYTDNRAANIAWSKSRRRT